MRLLLATLFTTAVLTACAPGALVQTSDPAPANVASGGPATPGVVATSSGTDCLTGDTCEFACPEGNCSFSCATDSTCSASCTGGDCHMSCATAATCDWSCPGGNCQYLCADGSDCDTSCAGGDCMSLR